MVLVAKKDDPSADRLRRRRMRRDGRHRSLANIRRVLRDCHRDGFRPDGAVKNLGLIREPEGGESVYVGNADEKGLKRNHRRLIAGKMDISFE